MHQSFLSKKHADHGFAFQNQPETVALFSAFRCRLYINDLFAELPLTFVEGDELSRQQRMRALLTYPEEVRFDLCLFWDVFNYLDADAIRALMEVLQPHLAPAAMAHCFGVHNVRSPQRDCKYSIAAPGELKLRPRPQAAMKPNTRFCIRIHSTHSAFDRKTAGWRCRWKTRRSRLAPRLWKANTPPRRISCGHFNQPTAVTFKLSTSGRAWCCTPMRAIRTS